MSIFHGVETIRRTVGQTKIDEVKTAVIFVVGTAPIHQVDAGSRPAVNSLQLITSDADYAKFGPDIAGYSIPEMLAEHALLKKGLVIAVNVFDPATHKTTVAEATYAIVGGKATLPNKDVISGTLVVKHINGPDVTAVENTDYTVDYVNGIVTVKPLGILAADANLKASFAYGNPAAVVASDVIGTTSVGGVRSGLQCAYDTMTAFGFNAKIFIAPRFASATTVQAALAAVADKMRGVWYGDAPAGTTRAQAITGRTPGNTPDLSSVHARGRICMPHWKRADGRVIPQSILWAVVRAWVDSTFGFWYSPSNKAVPGVSTLEIPISASTTDENSDTNLLNAAGLSTIFTAFGLGQRTWGNRTLAYPGSNGIETFECALVTRDVIEESIEIFAMKYQDLPVTPNLIDAVLADLGEYFNSLVGRGAAMPGSKAWFDPQLNPAVQLAAGKVKWSYKFCPPPPCEVPSFESTLDTTLLSNLAAA